MKAIVQDRYGSLDELRLADVERPTPREDEVLVRVRAASVHADVWHVVVGLPHVLRVMGAGLARPRNRTPGTDLAGVVEACGAAVTRFRPGDEVFGETIRGMPWVNGGAFAEYATAPESALALKPPGVGFVEAAAVPTTGVIALFNLRTLGRARAGTHVLINGAGGGVGTLAVQIAKADGLRVTAVDRRDKLDMLRALGADRVIDHEEEDFTRGDQRYDLVLDIPGNHDLAACLRVLEVSGRYVLVGHDGYGRGMNRAFGQIPRALGHMARALLDDRLPRAIFEVPDQAGAMNVLRDLLATGRLTPHVGRTFPLAEVPEALRCLCAGGTQGKIVVTM